MRISDQQIADLREYQVNAAYEQLAHAQTVLSSDRQINSPADNPYGTAVALDLQGRLSQNSQFAATASDTLSWMQTTDVALGGVGDALVQARTLAVQGANETLTVDQRKAIAGNVTQLIQQAMQSANASYGGRYVLSGFQTNTVPFALNSSGGVTYQGDTGVIQREISPGQTMQINTTGGVALPAVFQSLVQLQNDLQSGNTAAVGTADLQAIDQAHDGLLLAQATVGAGVNRIRAVQTSTETTRVTLQDQYSTIVDANMAAAAVEFSTRQATYQAALTMAAKVVQPSLLDFLK